MKRFFILFFCFCKLTYYSQKEVDTLYIIKIIKKAYSICENEPQLSIKLGKEALASSRKINFIKGEISACNTIGVGYDIASQYDSALHYYNKALSNFKNFNNPSLLASIYNNFGLTYWNLSEYKKAIANYYQALEIFKKTNDSKGLAKTYNNLGLLYGDMLDANSAIVNFKEAIKNYTFLNDSNGLSIAYVNLGSIYDVQDKYNDAEFYYRKSLPLKSAKDYYGKSIVLLNWGQVKNGINQLDSAILLLQQSINFKEKAEDTNGLITAYNVLSNTYYGLKQYNNSVTAAKKALELNRDIQSKKRLIRTYGLLKRAYLYINLPDSAMRYNELEYGLKDSVFSENLSEAIANEKVKYETLEVENENLTLKLKTEKQSFILKTIWIFLAFIFITGNIFLFFYLRAKKNKRIIQEQQRQNRINQVVLDTEQQERERIARDLHDSVGQKLSVVKMQLSVKDADVNSSSKLLDEAIQDVRNVSHNLMPADLSKGLIVALENMCEQINLSPKDLKVHFNHSIENVELNKQQESIVYRLIQELINNAIKYAKAKNIYIDLNYIKPNLHVLVKDDGVGFNVEEVRGKNGIGLNNLQQRVEKMNGKWELKTALGSGTSYHISILVN